MTLAEYLDKAETSDTAFAEMIGVSRQALHRYKTGERRPEWNVLERIRDVTGGQVTPNDFLDAPARETAP